MSISSDDSAQENAIPEIDRVPGFAHPREADFFFGNESAERELLEVARSGRIHHAWLLTGPPGIGKATLAYRFARFLLANPLPEQAEKAPDLSVPAESPVFRQIAHQAHPNLLVLRRPWQARTKRHAAAITVDEVRRLKSFLGQTPASGMWRIVIIDRADDLNINAVNALLKNLEEPPSSCLFLLVSSMPGRLPVTVRSRCRTLRLEPLADDELKQAIAHAGDGEELGENDDFKQCLALAEGSPGGALRFLAAGGGELYREVESLIGQMPSPDYGKLHDLADRLAAAGAQDRYELFFSILDSLISRLVKQGATGQGALEGERQMSGQLMRGGSLAQWASLWETLQRGKAEADALNLDRKTLILTVFFQIQDAVRQGQDQLRDSA